jgi:hypothetical protein
MLYICIDMNYIIIYYDRLVESIMFTIGSAYFAAGSYPEQQSISQKKHIPAKKEAAYYDDIEQGDSERLENMNENNDDHIDRLVMNNNSNVDGEIAPNSIPSSPSKSSNNMSSDNNGISTSDKVAIELERLKKQQLWEEEVLRVRRERAQSGSPRDEH